MTTLPVGNQQDVTIKLRLAADAGNSGVSAKLVEDVENAAKKVTAAIEKEGQRYADAMAAVTKKIAETAAAAWDQVAGSERTAIDKMIADVGRLEQQWQTSETKITALVTNEAAKRLVTGATAATSGAATTEEQMTFAGRMLDLGKEGAKEVAKATAEKLIAEPAADLLQKGFEKIGGAAAITTAVKGAAAEIASLSVPAAALGAQLGAAAIAGVGLVEGVKAVARSMGATGSSSESYATVIDGILTARNASAETDGQISTSSAAHSERMAMSKRLDAVEAERGRSRDAIYLAARRAALRENRGEAFDRKMYSEAEVRLDQAKQHSERDKREGFAFSAQAVRQSYKEAIESATRVFERDERQLEDAQRQFDEARRLRGTAGGASSTKEQLAGPDVNRLTSNLDEVQRRRDEQARRLSALEMEFAVFRTRFGPATDKSPYFGPLFEKQGSMDPALLELATAQRQHTPFNGVPASAGWQRLNEQQRKRANMLYDQLHPVETRNSGPLSPTRPSQRAGNQARASIERSGNAIVQAIEATLLEAIIRRDERVQESIRRAAARISAGAIT